MHIHVSNRTEANVPLHTYIGNTFYKTGAWNPNSKSFDVPGQNCWM